jgi:diguanylate cyclase (GGDEF)-like protein
VGREITRNLEPSAVFAALDRHVRELFDATALVIYRMAADGAALEMAFGVEAGAPLPAHALPIGHPLRQEARCAREAREIVARLAPGADDGAQGRLSMRSLMCAPLQVGDRLLGVMSIRSVAPDAYGEREVALFRTLCAYGAIALSNADVQAQLVEKNLQLEVLSASDRLTGLFNRLRLDQVLKEEQQRRARTGADLSVILLDLDHFRAVNDAFGHPVGDRVLASAAALLKAGARQTDVVGRWGGEEFLVICRETDLAGALVLAEKLRAMLAAHDFGDVPRRTGSFGAATLRPAEDVVSLIARVDAALYRAKHLGRDRVEAEEPPAATRAGR